jgi:hypothetical protein
MNEEDSRSLLLDEPSSDEEQRRETIPSHNVVAGDSQLISELNAWMNYHASRKWYFHRETPLK